MTSEDVLRMQGVARVLAACARVNARVAGMHAVNAERIQNGCTPAYGENAFLGVIDDEGAGANQVEAALGAGL